MQRCTVERIEDWSSRQFTEGDVKLHDLASSGFSGAVHANAWILMCNGRSVGVFDGSVEEITTGGTIYVSPEPILPVLLSMMEQEPTQNTRYHTDTTPIDEARSALENWDRDRDYIGYLELTTDTDEYYVVYGDAGTTSIAFVGPEKRILMGEQADDMGDTISGEYTVSVVPIDPVDVTNSESTTQQVPSGLPPGKENVDVRTNKRTDENDSKPELIADGSNESVEHLRSRIAALERERDALQTERDDLLAERDRLEARISELKKRIKKLESTAASTATSPSDSDSASASDSTSASDNRNEMSVDDALSGTSLFVRYHTQNHSTLTDAYHGDATPEEVNENLILEHYTTFDAENTVVDGTPFDQFLTESFEYAVVSWIVRDLLYDIYDAGYEDDLADLYDYIPDIDRAALHAHNTTDDGVPVSFDVVCFDQRGDPLIVVQIDDSREPTTARETETLLDDASAAADQWPLTAALLVTTSYFEASALDTAADATTGGGGLFSSGNRSSYVRLSRKHGFHLCLVEARQRQFHVAAPKL